MIKVLIFVADKVETHLPKSDYFWGGNNQTSVTSFDKIISHSQIKTEQGPKP